MDYLFQPSQVPEQLTTEPSRAERLVFSPPRPSTQVISINPTSNGVGPPKKIFYPPVLWVIGGPGSNKATLCAAASNETGWHHISLGKLLRAAADVPNRNRNQEVSFYQKCKLK